MSVSEAFRDVVDESMELTELAPDTNRFHLEPPMPHMPHRPGADKGQRSVGHRSQPCDGVARPRRRQRHARKDEMC
jgi:hypothetical protein